jgi:hypothetical protein
MTAAERECLQRMLRDAPTKLHRWKEGAENALVLWAASMLALVLAWLTLAWLARKLFQFDMGSRSPAALWVIGIGVALCALGAFVSSVRWIRGWSDHRPLLQDDLAGGRVIEERFVFTAVKRSQEPEHGGLMYFLRSDDGHVLTLFDHESQDLGAGGKDPLTSKFEPRTELTLVRAPHAGFVVEQCFSGNALDAGPPLDLAVEPHQWPEPETYCNIPWDELEARLGKRAGAAPAEASRPS